MNAFSVCWLVSCLSAADCEASFESEAALATGADHGLRHQLPSLFLTFNALPETVPPKRNERDCRN
jgi:hypothetical protein